MTAPAKKVSAVDALGSAQPAACGGVNFGAKAATAAPAVEAAKAGEDIAVKE